VRASVRLSDATGLRFNPPAEPAQTVGFGEWDSKTGFGKREWD